MSGRLLACVVVFIFSKLLPACDRPTASSPKAAADSSPQPAVQRDGLRSMKGWEVYVWESDQGPRFSLLMGTNRNKSASEIFDPAPIETFDREWSIASAAPLENIRTSLSRLASGQSVFVSGVQRSGPEDFKTFLPSDEILKSLRKISIELGLKMN